MGKRKISARPAGIQKEKCGWPRIFQRQLNNHKPKKALKYKECMAISFKIKAQLSLKNAWLPPIFFQDSDSPR